MKEFHNFPCKSVKKRLAGGLGLCLFLLITPFYSAHAQTPMMIGLGDSLGEGVQSADANLRTQPFSYINLIAKQMDIFFPLPLIKSCPSGIVFSTSGRSRLLPYLPSPNLAVSGATIHSMLYDRADALTEDDINAETDLVLFPRLGSQIEIAESVSSPMVVCWIGNNDLLSAIIPFSHLDATQMTPVKSFEHDFNEAAERLSKAGDMIVFANIPDVTNIAFLVDREDLIKFLSSDLGLPEGSYTTVWTMALIGMGMANEDLLEDPDYVLDAEEIRLIQERTEEFNRIIQEAADSIGMPVVDINGLFDEITVTPPVFFGTPVTTRFLGGLFSLDGVHPSNIGHALIANSFIKIINSHFNKDIPIIEDNTLAWIFLRDPFVDINGDNKVRGRLGAGLLETLAPFLLRSLGTENPFIQSSQ